MHIEILVEDSSGKTLLDILVPKVLGEYSAPHTWNIHAYKGMGRIPKNLQPSSAPNKRILLDQLPRVLRGYAKTPGIDAVIVVLDLDKRNCTTFLQQLQALADDLQPPPEIMFRLAIEELEAWYFGDLDALLCAYPKVKRSIIHQYIQDSACDTWECLADAVYDGGSRQVKKIGWPLPGQLKHEWANAIGPHMDLDRNTSPSFGKFRDGLRRLITRDGV